MTGSFNTREFFHGAPQATFKAVKRLFLISLFPLPVVLLSLGLSANAAGVFVIAFAVQYAGLLTERWFFFADANHPQNLYYQTV
jgi:DMSO reductase anchor subunit